MTWERYLDLFLEGDVLFGSWFKHVQQGWEQAQRSPNTVLFLRLDILFATSRFDNSIYRHNII